MSRWISSLVCACCVVKVPRSISTWMLPSIPHFPTMARLDPGTGKPASAYLHYLLQARGVDRIKFDSVKLGYEFYLHGEPLLFLSDMTFRMAYPDYILTRVDEAIARKEKDEQDRRAQEEDQAGEPGQAGEGEANRAACEEEREDPGLVLAGWRGWKCEQASTALKPMTSSEPWNLVDVNVAECNAVSFSRDFYPERTKHAAPHPDCNCGLWSYRSYELMEKYVDALLQVYGVVALGGEVEEHEWGYRAREARIVALLESEHSERLKYNWQAANWWNQRVNLHEFDAKEPPPFPVPILSAAECEMLAMDQDCVFEQE